MTSTMAAILQEAIDEYIPEPNPNANVPLLRKMVEWVEEQSKLEYKLREWDQVEWMLYSDKHCGTVMCVAGKTALTCGWEQIEDTLMMEKGGRQLPVQEAAEEELGINKDQAFLLFRASNTARDIRHIAEAIAGERI